MMGASHGTSDMNKRPSDRKAYGFNVKPAEHPSKRLAGTWPLEPQSLGPLADNLRQTLVSVPLEEYLRLNNCAIVSIVGDTTTSPNAARSLNLIYNGIPESPIATSRKGTSVHITTDINKHDVRGILDSGATLSIMTKNTIEHPGLVDQIKPSNATFVTANGEKVM